jgi:ribonuclease P protein component
VLASGKRFSSASLELFAIRDLSRRGDRYQVAFLISKECGSAVRRNQIKRWLREDFRRFQDVNRLPGEYAVKFKVSASNINHYQLVGELDTLFGLLKINGQ